MRGRPFLVCLVLVSCSRPAPLDPPPLENATLVLPGFDSLRVPLLDGAGEIRNEEGVLVASAGLTEWRLVRDFDRDGRSDALVVAWSSGGGSGTFMELAHFVPGEDGPPRWIWRGSVTLGDRVQVREMTETSVGVRLHLRRHGPDDPMCCPSVDAVTGFAVVDGRLIAS